MGERVMMLMVVILSTVCVFAHTHSNEPPHAKYSKEINEQAAQSAGLEHNVHDHTHGHSHGSSKCPYAHSTGKQYIARSQSHLWTYAIGATLLISAAPCILLLFIPIQDNSPSNGPWLKVLLAFGSGGLLGDAFLHLIPHALPGGSHSHSHSFTMGHSHEPHDMSVGGWVLTGIIAFLLVEKLVRIIRGEDSHCHSHDVGARKKTDHSDDDLMASEDKAPEIKETKISQADKQEPDRIKVAAYLNLVADFAHNFTDGLAIGASFIAGNTVGVVTMITVLVHEVPHEIGDFAILIQSGYSKKKAMTIQLVTALGALSGCCLSLWVADPAALADAASSSWILPFTAGGFIYIATVSVIPELLENSSTGQSIREILALLTGIFMMYLIAMYE